MTTSMPKKSSGEQLGGNTFSYAQAAKGRSPSVPNTALTAEKPAAKRTASEGQATLADDFKEQKNSNTTSPAGNEEHKIFTPSSPEYGTASASTLPKEEDISATQNSSSEFTWEKISQSSQSGTKDGESGKRDTDTASWADESSASVSLRDAPPPAVNFWEQRKEQLQAKAKAIKPVASPSSKTSDSHNPLEAPNGSRVSVGSSEVKKGENHKKAKGNPGSTESNLGTNGTKDWSRAAVEGKPKNGDEGISSAKNASKMARSPESSKPNASNSAPPPPPGDAVSWPTPDTAQDEEKKRSQERAEKAEKEKITASKPNSKKEWTTMPFVPSAVFSTPIPQSRRGGGGRPSRGGRETSGGRGGSILQTGNGAEKPMPGNVNSAATQPPANSNERSRAEPNANMNTPPSAKSKRSASAGPPIVRTQRKGGENTSTERRKEVEPKVSRTNTSNMAAIAEPNGISASTQTDSSANGAFNATSTIGDALPWNARVPREDPERAERRPSGFVETHAHPRSGGEKRSDVAGRPFDHSRDFYGTSSVRERSEGQRGRGNGYRNRNGGSHAVATPISSNGQGFVNSQALHQSPAMGSSRPQLAHERHSSQSQGVSYMQSQPHPRAYRSGSRSQSIPHPGSPFLRYTNGPYAPPSNLASIQTDVANTFGYQPGVQGVMSAQSFNSFAEQQAVQMFGMVAMQLEYYFSVDNLCKDMFLRKHMDSKGYVFLSVLVGFNRMKQLTQDMELIRWVCIHSTNIDIRTAADGIDRLRKRDGWEQWVLIKEERDPSAQNDGPSHVEIPRVQQPPMLAMPFGYDGVSEAVTPYIPPHHIVDESSNLQTRNGTVAPSIPTAAAPTTNGTISEATVIQTPLSASVPDFAPNLPHTNGQGSSSLDPLSHNANLFTDEQVENLVIVVRKPISQSAPMPPPFASASTRTFSNGSIDGRTISDELSKFEERQPRPKINGNLASDIDELNIIKRSRSPFKVSPPKRQGNSHAPPVFWVKDKETPIDSLPNDVARESYHVFRANAFRQREQSESGICHSDMDILYQFWSHFLIRNFNPRMYEEFRRMSFEDAKNQNSMVGMTNLVQYYDESMLGQKVMSDDIAHDFVDLVKSEGSSKERPAFDKLRAAWRNGATNMKNRKKIGTMIDADLKAQLER